jgi:mono/diheme cytochrome c family protein
MNRLFVSFAGLALALALASCGGKPAGGSSASGAPAATPASSGTGGGVLATSKFDAGPRAGETPRDEEKAKQGKALFQSKGCSACHAFGKKLTGPDLQGVTMRRTALWIENQILHPDVMVKEDPISHELFAKFALQMPKQGLTPDEARAVIEFFKEQDHEAGLTKSESHE